MNGDPSDGQQAALDRLTEENQELHRQLKYFRFQKKLIRGVFVGFSVDQALERWVAASSLTKAESEASGNSVRRILRNPVPDQETVDLLGALVRRYTMLRLVGSLGVFGAIAAVIVQLLFLQGQNKQIELQADQFSRSRETQLLEMIFAEPGNSQLRATALREYLGSTTGTKLTLDSLDFSAGNLSGVDLSSTSLFGANLAGASIDRASFTNADLRLSKLRGLDLRTAAMDGASLDWADLTGSVLSPSIGEDGKRATRPPWCGPGSFPCQYRNKLTRVLYVPDVRSNEWAISQIWCWLNLDHREVSLQCLSLESPEAHLRQVAEQPSLTGAEPLNALRPPLPDERILLELVNDNHSDPGAHQFLYLQIEDGSDGFRVASVPDHSELGTLILLRHQDDNCISFMRDDGKCHWPDFLLNPYADEDGD